MKWNKKPSDGWNQRELLPVQHRKIVWRERSGEIMAGTYDPEHDIFKNTHLTTNIITLPPTVIEWAYIDQIEEYDENPAPVDIYSNVPIERWRRKTITIEAIQFNSAYSLEKIKAFIGDHFLYSETKEGHPYFAIETLEGKVFANPGDWIIRGANNEFFLSKSIKPLSFRHGDRYTTKKYLDIKRVFCNYFIV